VALPNSVRELLQEHITTGSFELPLLPDSAAQVLEACNDESCDARRIAELLQRDQGLTGHVLRIANSAAYAAREPVVSLQQAISRLGLRGVREVGIALGVRGRIFRAPGWQGRMQRMWRHSAAAGAYAKEIARAKRRHVEGAFLCGLLHDVGKPVVLQALVDVLQVAGLELEPGVAEAAMVEFHAEIGARMVESFGLAPWMCTAIRYHHDYAAAHEHREEAMLTCLADRLAHWCTDPEAGPEDFPAEQQVVLDLNLYADELALLLEKRARVLGTVEAFS
jgi:putative nucleotidyltransferase with HDIG domain